MSHARGSCPKVLITSGSCNLFRCPKSAYNDKHRNFRYLTVISTFQTFVSCLEMKSGDSYLGEDLTLIFYIHIFPLKKNKNISRIYANILSIYSYLMTVTTDLYLSIFL